MEDWKGKIKDTLKKKNQQEKDKKKLEEKVKKEFENFVKDILTPASLEIMHGIAEKGNVKFECLDKGAIINVRLNDNREYFYHLYYEIHPDKIILYKDDSLKKRERFKSYDLDFNGFDLTKDQVLKDFSDSFATFLEK
jgi:hypothetical protein